MKDFMLECIAEATKEKTNNVRIGTVNMYSKLQTFGPRANNVCV